MVQEVHEIRKRQGPNPGLGPLLPRVQAYLKAAASGEQRGLVQLWVLQCELSIQICFMFSGYSKHSVFWEQLHVICPEAA